MNSKREIERGAMAKRDNPVHQLRLATFPVTVWKSRVKGIPSLAIVDSSDTGAGTCWTNSAQRGRG